MATNRIQGIPGARRQREGELVTQQVDTNPAGCRGNGTELSKNKEPDSDGKR